MARLVQSPVVRPRRGLGEEGLGALAALAEYRSMQAEPPVAVSRRRWVLPVARGVAGVLAAVYLFTIALKLLSASAPGVASLFERLSIHGVTNLVGFGW